jgi:hypothetical protein
VSMRNRGSILLTQWVHAQGLTYVELAARLGTARRGSSLSVLATGGKRPGRKLRAKLERVTKIPCGSWDEWEVRDECDEVAP